MIDPGMYISELTEKELDDLDDSDMSSCDCCEVIWDSVDLVWIDAEDFKERDDDDFNLDKYKAAIKKYSALCTDCYFKHCTDREV